MTTEEVKTNEYFTPVYNKKGKITSIIDNRYHNQEINSIERVISILNEQQGTIRMWCESSSRLKKLLEENTKPTTNDGGDVYLSIGEDKRCRYEKTFICNKCKYFSNYFLDCRLMMGDDQYQKAVKLGLVE